jgi:hypothetical protein
MLPSGTWKMRRDLSERLEKLTSFSLDYPPHDCAGRHKAKRCRVFKITELTHVGPQLSTLAHDAMTLAKSCSLISGTRL